ncbi:MAG TPA: hypothetical protein VE077_19000 [Candidatus Methylomirabilis sp.]|nr:hypothetical protein [Candidatus Methylomirabilis sp.]
MEKRTGGPSARLPQFSVEVDAGQWGRLQVEAKWLTFTLAQKIRTKEAGQMFDSVGIYCTQEHNDALVIRVVIFHPDWAAPLQIARIESRPETQEELLEPIGINLNHVSLTMTDWRN